jgi:hypothetical protein
MTPQRWTPNPEALTLDGIGPKDHPLFRYILTRNGHNVSLYGGRDKCESDLRDRAARFPMDDWGIVDRQEGR